MTELANKFFGEYKALLAKDPQLAMKDQIRWKEGDMYIERGKDLTLERLAYYADHVCLNISKEPISEIHNFAQKTMTVDNIKTITGANSCVLGGCACILLVLTKHPDYADLYKEHEEEFRKVLARFAK